MQNFWKLFGFEPSGLGVCRGIPAAFWVCQPFLPRRILNSSGLLHTHIQSHAYIPTLIHIDLHWHKNVSSVLCLRISFLPNPNPNPFQMRIYFYKILQKSKTHTHILTHTHTYTNTCECFSRMEKGHFWGHRIYINPYGCRLSKCVCVCALLWVHSLLSSSIFGSVFGHVPLTESKNFEKRMLHMQPYGIFAYHTKLMLPPQLPPPFLWMCMCVCALDRLSNPLIAVSRRWANRTNRPKMERSTFKFRRLYYQHLHMCKCMSICV